MGFFQHKGAPPTKPIPVIVAMVAFTLRLSDMIRLTVNKPQKLQQKLSSTVTTTEYQALQDQLSGTCTCDEKHSDNHPQSVSPTIPEGKLHITDHNANHIDVKEKGHYINVYSDKFEQTQICLKKSATECIMYAVISGLSVDTKELGKFEILKDREIKISVLTGEIASSHGTTLTRLYEQERLDVEICSLVKTNRVPCYKVNWRIQGESNPLQSKLSLQSSHICQSGEDSESDNC